jgi:hypothetical protein
MTPKFVLAKYVPDLGRMEPRNIGVFVWWKGEIRSKFLTVAEASFVSEPETYARWVTFWAKRIEGNAVRPTRGRPVPKSAPECLEALISTQKGNYILVDSGELLSPIKKSDLRAATEYLFKDLVAPPTGIQSEESQESFTNQCNGLFERAGIEFKRRAPIECKLRGVKQHLHPDYYVGNGEPDAIFQRAKVSQEHSVNSAAWLVSAILDQAVVPKSSCRILVRSEDINGSVAEEGMRLFESLCGTIDISASDARDQLSAVAAGNGRH